MTLTASPDPGPRGRQRISASQHRDLADIASGLSRGEHAGTCAALERRGLIRGDLDTGCAITPAGQAVLDAPEPTYYAVVPSRGCYGSGDRVSAVSVHDDLLAALRSAEARSRRYRASMARHGGSSGGYRVVETVERRARDTSWLGHELDRTPSVTPIAAPHRV